ncbi:MAG TPA: peptidylprolyl isomerase [Nitrospiria bacterium]|nr:peptidylprolyl isomerase [Nitrospiria bacterium]
MRWILGSLLIVSPFFLGVAWSASGEEAKPTTVSAGKVVSIEYTLKLEDQSTVDSNVGGEPLRFIQGEHQIIPGLETALEGLKVGDTKSVRVKPADGYGEVDPKAMEEIEKSRIPPEALVIGTPLEGNDPSGRPIHATVREIKEKTVVLDLNHPLAGKTLLFDVKILAIEAQVKPEAPEHPNNESGSGQDPSKSSR